MYMPYHLRYTPYELSHDLDAFLEKYDTYVVAYENKDKDGAPEHPHYHMYIKSDLNEDTIRKHWLKTMEIPKCGKGRNNKYYMLKKYDENIDYICKYADVRKYKGFTKDDIENASKEGFNKYLLKRQSHPEESTEGRVTTKKDVASEWNKILANAMNYHRENGRKEILFDRWVKLIRHWYLKELKPLPHPANLKRYALSLDALCRSDWGENDEALQKEIEGMILPD